jgi:hypothetical protein
MGLLDDRFSGRMQCGRKARQPPQEMIFYIEIEISVKKKIILPNKHVRGSIIAPAKVQM